MLVLGRSDTLPLFSRPTKAPSQSVSIALPFVMVAFVDLLHTLPGTILLAPVQANVLLNQPGRPIKRLPIFLWWSLKWGDPLALLGSIQECLYGRRRVMDAPHFS